MKLTKIKDALAMYAEFLKTDKAYENVFLYHGIQVFQDNWDISVDELSKMYINATDNSTSNRLWLVDNAHPREVMSAFFHYDPTYTKFMFKDLFTEEMSIESRLERFTFHADQLFQELQKHFTNSPYNTHFQTARVASMYLAHHRPQSYLIFNWSIFKEFIPFLEMTNPPTYADPDRYYKIGKTLFNFILKDQELLTAHQERLEVEKHYIFPCQMMVYELMHLIAHRPFVS